MHMMPHIYFYFCQILNFELKLIEKAIFKYHTGAVPPPYCFEYSLEIAPREDKLEVTFNLTYLDREELELEEILEEGFTENDDYSWTGELALPWKKVLLSKLDTKSISSISNIQTSEQLQLVLHKNNEEKVFELNASDWNIFLNEFIQAIYETAGKELPLHLCIAHVQNGSASYYHLDFLFSLRKLILRIEEKNSPIKHKKGDWDAGGNLMKLLFNLDYEAVGSWDKIPRTDGWYIDLGEEIWLDLEAAAGEETNNDWLEIIVEQLKKIIR